MQCLLWEHLKCAVGNFIIILRIILRGIRLGHVGKDNLDVAFGSKGSALQQRGSGCDTPAIYVESCMNVIQSISDDSQVLEEFISEDMRGTFMHFVKSGDDVLLQLWIHGNGCRSSC